MYMWPKALSIMTALFSQMSITCTQTRHMVYVHVIAVRVLSMLDHIEPLVLHVMYMY